MHRIAIWTANGALFVLCCYLIAAALNLVAAELLAPVARAVAPRAAPPAPRARSWNERRQIVERNLFGVDNSKSVAVALPPVEDEEELAATKLPLRLLGTAASSLDRLSWAAVEDLQKREHQVVQLGDRVQGARVAAIQRRRIVLENQGRREELALEDEKSNGSGRGRATARRPPARRTARNDRRDLGGRIRRLNENRFQLNRDDVEAARRSPAQLMQGAQIVPKREGGEMVGLELKNVQSGSLFEQVGLASGDVVMEFNGISISNPQESAQVLRELSDSSSWAVKVRGADGAERTLTYEFAD